MSIPESESGNIFPVPPEEELLQLGPIPIGGPEPDFENLLSLVEQTTESPFPEAAEAPEAINNGDNTDILTGMKEGEPNIPLGT